MKIAVEEDFNKICKMSGIDVSEYTYDSKKNILMSPERFSQLLSIAVDLILSLLDKYESLVIDILAL
jgi:hypothetical protein